MISAPWRGRWPQGPTRISSLPLRLSSLSSRCHQYEPGTLNRLKPLNAEWLKSRGRQYKKTRAGEGSGKTKAEPGDGDGWEQAWTAICRQRKSADHDALFVFGG